jgi:hypothetical protein
VPTGSAAALDELGRAAKEVWLVGGVGRVLPARLFEALLRAAYSDAGVERADEDADQDEDRVTERIPLERFDRVAGPRGLERPYDAATRVDCPVVPELLRPLN